MNEEQIKKIIDNPPKYDEEKEESYFAWANACFKKSQRWAIVLVFGHFFIFLALGIISGILFFQTDSTKDQIMYAAFFVCCIIIGYLIKVFAWVLTSRNSIKREIKRLEIRIAELSETIKNQ